MGDKFLGVGCYDVDLSIEKKLMKTFIHPNARKHFKIALMVINHSYIPPHTDNDLKMVMNLYMKTADATTYFWRPKNDVVTTLQLEMQTDGRLFREDDLECVASFRAETNDLWMLNVSKIHSVRSMRDELRVAFCFQSTTLNFENVLEKIDQIIL